MSCAIISAGCHATALHSHTKSTLEPCSHLSFNTHLPISSFPPKTHNSKSIRARPIKAAVADHVYVNTQSFYDLLGISEGGTLSEIKKAYKQLARKYHPDVSPPDMTKEYTKRFIEVQEAYETLSDPQTRALYDRDLASGLHLAFNARKHRNENLDDMFEWRHRWESQLTELHRRRMNEDLRENLSWGARMRRQRSQVSV